MSAIIGIVIAVLAIFIIVKVAGFVFKVLGVLLLVGLGIGAFLVVRKKLGGPR